MRRQTIVILSSIAMLGSLTACSMPMLWGPEYICDTDEHITWWAISRPGSRCVKDGKEPPAGYLEYPPGDVPSIVGEEYWPPKRYPELKEYVEVYREWYAHEEPRPAPPPYPEVEIQK